MGSSKPTGNRNTTDFDVEMGARIRRWRVKAGLSQTALGRQLGVSCHQIQKYEGGTNRLSAARVQKLSVILNVSTEDFFASEIKSVEVRKINGANDPSTLRLLRAYANIKDPVTKHRVVELLEKIAASRDR